MKVTELRWNLIFCIRSDRLHSHADAGFQTHHPLSSEVLFTHLLWSSREIEKKSKRNDVREWLYGVVLVDLLHQNRSVHVSLAGWQLRRCLNALLPPCALSPWKLVDRSDSVPLFWPGGSSGRQWLSYTLHSCPGLSFRQCPWAPMFGPKTNSW